MKDSIGKTINVGDKVAFVQDSNSSPKMGLGVVEKIYKSDDACTVSGKPNIYEFRLLKLPNDFR